MDVNDAFVWEEDMVGASGHTIRPATLKKDLSGRTMVDMPEEQRQNTMSYVPLIVDQVIRDNRVMMDPGVSCEPYSEWTDRFTNGGGEQRCRLLSDLQKDSGHYYLCMFGVAFSL